MMDKKLEELSKKVFKYSREGRPFDKEYKMFLLNAVAELFKNAETIRVPEIKKKKR